MRNAYLLPIRSKDCASDDSNQIIFKDGLICLPEYRDSKIWIVFCNENTVIEITNHIKFQPKHYFFLILLTDFLFSGRGHRNVFMTKSPRKNSGRGDRTRGRLHAKRTRHRSSYRARYRHRSIVIRDIVSHCLYRDAYHIGWRPYRPIPTWQG